MDSSVLVVVCGGVFLGHHEVLLPVSPSRLHSALPLEGEARRAAPPTALQPVKLSSCLTARGYMSLYTGVLGVVRLCERACGHFLGRVPNSHPAQEGQSLPHILTLTLRVSSQFIRMMRQFPCLTFALFSPSSPTPGHLYRTHCQHPSLANPPTQTHRRTGLPLSPWLPPPRTGLS